MYLLYLKSCKVQYFPQTNFVDLVQAPTPFIIGGSSSWAADISIDTAIETEDFNIVETLSPEDEFGQASCKRTGFVKVDLDMNEIIDTINDQNIKMASRLPGRAGIIRQLRQLLFSGLRQSDGFPDPCIHSSMPEFTPNIEEGIRNIFLSWFVGIFRGLGRYYRLDGKFDKNEWISSLSSEDSSFYSVFAAFQR